MGNLPIFLLTKLVHKDARSPIFLRGEYSEWNRRLVPEPIQNKQRIFLQMSIPILIYVSNFVYFTIQEKKKEKIEEHMRNQEKFEHPQGNGGLGME